jgi:uncharacterized protein (DUF362 family)
LDRLNRRDFLKLTGIAGGAVLLGLKGKEIMAAKKSAVVLKNTNNRKEGVQGSLKALGINPVKGKNVLIKPNFNTADITPGSTHNDTLTALVEEMWAMGAKTISLGERSYPLTREVMEQKGVLPLLEKLNVIIINFDDLDKKDWVEVIPKDSHWKNGFRIARPVLESECLVSTGCLKTHQFGGIFTMSLKLHVGVVPTTRHGFEYMRELHTSPHQRKLIAELNQPFTPQLVILDGVDAFVDGGPATGKTAKGDVFLASADRVAIDAVGVAVLKHLGSTPAIMNTPIFQQEQIARAVELGLGVATPADIDLIAADEKSKEYRDRIQAVLNQG